MENYAILEDPQQEPMPEEGVILDMPIVEEKESIAPTVDHLKALELSYLQKYLDGSPIKNTYEQNKYNPDKDTTLQDLSFAKVQEDNKNLVRAFTEQEYETQQDIVATSAAVQDIKNKTILAAGDADRQFVESLALPETSYEDVGATTNMVKLFKVFAQAAEDVSTMDVVGDFALGLLPLYETIRQTTATGTLFGSEDVMYKTIDHFKRLPFEEQQELFPQLIQDLVADLGPILGLSTAVKFIEAGGEEDLFDFSNFWKLFDAAEIGGGLAALKNVKSWSKVKEIVDRSEAAENVKLPGGKTIVAGTANTANAAGEAVKAAVKKFNLPKITAKVGDVEEAGAQNASAIVDPKAAEAMNISPTTAMLNGAPLNMSDVDPAYTPGISSATVRAFTGKVDDTVNDIIEKRTYTREGFLQTTERAEAQANAEAKLKALQYEDIRLVSRVGDVNTYTYKYRDKEGVLHDGETTIEFTVNDVGVYDVTEEGLLSSLLASNSVLAKGKARVDVAQAERLDAQIAKAQNELMKLANEAIKPLGNMLTRKGRAKLARVDGALMDGDEFFDEVTGVRGKVFTPEELKGQLGLKTPEEIEAYYNIRDLYDGVHRIRDATMRKEMAAKGMKDVYWPLADGSDYTRAFGAPIDTHKAAMDSMTRKQVTKYFDTVKGKVVDVTPQKLQGAYQHNRVLVRLQEPTTINKKDGAFQYVLVDKNDITNLPDSVLPKRIGYVPRVYKNGAYFVKEFSSKLIDGKLVSKGNVKTVRFFDNKRDADLFAKEQNAEAAALAAERKGKRGKPRAGDDKTYEAFSDRELEIIGTATGDHQSLGSGGLYTGARSEDALLFGLNGDEAERLNSFEALSTTMANVARYSTINEARLGMEQRWLNTANKLGISVKKFGELPSSGESSNKIVFLNNMAKRIRDWQGFPTKEEQLFNGTIQNMYDWVSGWNEGGRAKTALQQALKDGLGWMRGKDPISRARAMAFHPLLGWFNPIQLFVQANGIAVALSLNLGKNAASVLRKTMGMTAIGSVEMSPELIRRGAKVSGMKEADFKELIDTWRRTGLEEGILQTADHAAAMKGHGITMEAISRASDKGLFFYSHGELFNRRHAFSTAFEEWKAENKGMKVTDEGLKEIMDRANNLLLNMGKANRAAWQKGVMSIPTQFLQVSTKSLETMLGVNGNLTAAERWRMFGGQVALYGTAGVPIANAGVQWLLEVGGVSQKDLNENPELVKLFNDGFIGYTTLAMFGVDAEVASRGSLLRGVSDIIDRIVLDESSGSEKVLGAFGSAANRFWTGINEQLRPLMAGAYPQDIIDVVKIPTLPVLRTISSWRNAEKAFFMERIGKILTTRGDVLVKDDFSTGEIVAKAIGLQLTREQRAYTLQERTNNSRAYEQRVADSIVKQMNEAVMRIKTGTADDEWLEENKQTYALLLGTIENPYRRKVVMRSVRERLGRDSIESRNIRKYLEDTAVGTTQGLLTMKDYMLGSRMITTEPYQED